MIVREVKWDKVVGAKIFERVGMVGFLCIFSSVHGIYNRVLLLLT
jgi:hypothetical protein